MGLLNVDIDKLLEETAETPVDDNNTRFYHIDIDKLLLNTCDWEQSVENNFR
ncbi:hypothetical protein [Peribacillus saganii]|uniref:hypothetical protein n=1 Tax=Peribacillus saganii TaxID=2303992 RepID=UPI0013149414|nr:hypothetical protein [Peribacillus saganii]